MVKYHVAVMNPAGNITVIVKTFVEQEKRAMAAKALMECRELHAEQVGFVTLPVHGGSSRLHMMGGEFCGNATRSFGYCLAMERGMIQGEILVEISGCEQPLLVYADTEKQTAITQMPCEISVEEISLADGMTFPVVKMEGISHIILENQKVSPERTELLMKLACQKIDSEALGILYLEQDQMTPAVYVKQTDSLVYERSCGSGSVAAAVYRAVQESSGDFVYHLRQPGGTIEVFLQKKNGKIDSCRMGGSISVLTEQDILLDVE